MTTIACTLSDPERRRRLAWIREAVVRRSSVLIAESRHIELQVPGPVVPDARELVDLERGCCAFLDLELDVPDTGPARLSVVGPPGSEPILAEWLGERDDKGG